MRDLMSSQPHSGTPVIMPRKSKDDSFQAPDCLQLPPSEDMGSCAGNFGKLPLPDAYSENLVVI